MLAVSCRVLMLTRLRVKCLEMNFRPTRRHNLSFMLQKAINQVTKTAENVKRHERPEKVASINEI